MLIERTSTLSNPLEQALIQNSPVNSNLSRFIYEVVVDQQIPNQKKWKQVAKIIGYTFACTIGYGTCIPFINSSLAYDKDHTLRSKSLAYIGAVGSFAAFGTAATWGLANMVNESLRSRSELEEKLSTKSSSILLRVIHIGSSIIFGVAARIPAGEVALKFNGNVPLAIACILGEAGVPIYSMYCLLNEISNVLAKKLRKQKNFDKQFERQLLLVKNKICSSIQTSITQGIKLPLNERQRHFQCFYSAKQIKGNTTINSLVKELLAFHLSDTIQPFRQRYRMSSNLKRFIQIMMLVPGTFLLLENALMTDEACRSLSHNLAIRITTVALAVLPMIWVSLKVPGMAVVNMMEQFFGLCGFERSESFAESFYPKLYKSLKLLSICIAVMPFAEIDAVAEQYASWNTTYGKLFIASNIVALTLLIINAANDLIENAIQKFAGSQWADREIREALVFKQRLEQLQSAILQSSPVEFAKFVQGSISCDEELKSSLLKGVLSKDELSEYIENHLNETTSLLA
ncbi:MAG: hypothetical protein K0S74_15 [Chlamydiales bacterium]|jgi:hypothetical protein|nr:hypothetical protein [Chlamydiales bacterium]